MPVVELHLDRVAVLLPRVAAEHRVAHHESLNPFHKLKVHPRDASKRSDWKDDSWQYKVWLVRKKSTNLG